MKKIIFTFAILITTGLAVFASKFVPEFNLMTTLKCTVNEEIFEKDGSLVTKNKYYRFYNLDDENQKIYLQKAPVERIKFYDNTKIEFKTQHLTDDFIMQSNIVIDRAKNSIESKSTIDYDNEDYPSRIAIGKGICEELK